MLDEISTNISTLSVETEMFKPKEIIMRIPIILGQPLNEGSVKTAVGVITLKDLHGRFKIPEKKPKSKKGYQRKLSAKRVKDLSDSVRKGEVDVVPSVLLNLRPSDFKKCFKKEGKSHFLIVDPDDEIHFFVVDGQHRIQSMMTLYEQDSQKWGEFKLQFVVMLGAEMSEELRQFYIVNSEAKSVPTDLAYALLKDQVDMKKASDRYILATDQLWKVEGYTIAEKMSEESEVWAGKIRLPNMEKGETILPVASLVNSLKSPNKSDFFGNLPIDKRFAIVEAYWQGIRSTCPEPFGENAHVFSLCKGLGVSLMHELLPLVLHHVNSNGRSVTDADAFEEIMEPVLRKLSDTNSEGKNVNGASFWLAAKYGGAAGAFSSAAGKRLLIAKMKVLLPDLKV